MVAKQAGNAWEPKARTCLWVALRGRVRGGCFAPAPVSFGWTL